MRNAGAEHGTTRRRVTHGPACAALLLTMLLAALGIPPASAQDETGLPIPVVRSFSGSPLLLEIYVTDQDKRVSEVGIDSGVSTQIYRIPDEAPRDPLVLRVSPFILSGSYSLAITLRAEDGDEATSAVQIGFVDFVWGRDNLSFGNNGEYRSVVGTFGEILTNWVDDRFNGVSAEEQVLLVDYMYGLFGRNTGRCYAFAGTEVRYWRWPELLPSYYEAAHELRSTSARYQRDMNYLQFDIVFDHFLAGPGTQQIARAMTRDEIADQAREVESRIARNEPVAVGFAGPDLHHSMLVFGYIRNDALNTIDLLVANNWKSDEKLNIHSRDAEIVRLHLADEHEGPRVVWVYDDGVRNREIDRLFVVDVPRDPAVHNRAILDQLLNALGSAFRSDERIRVVVEDAAGARLTDGNRTTGRFRNRASQEIDGVWYERVGSTYRFSYPAELGTGPELEIIEDENQEARILAIAPPVDGNGSVVLLDPIELDSEDGFPNQTGTPIHRFALRPRVAAEGEGQ